MDLYDDFSEDIKDDANDSNIKIEELLRIHYYFEEKQIQSILSELNTLIGDSNNEKN